VWTSAVTAGGTVSFSGAGSNVRIYGDLTSLDLDEYHPQLKEYASPEGNRNGVVSLGGKADVFGNVYSRGDVHVAGSGGAIYVHRYPAYFGATYKRNLYGNTLYFDTSIVPAMIQRYTQAEDEPWSRTFVPFFYRDHLGGNVYCNSLAIEEGVVGGRIGVDNAPAAADGGSVALAGVTCTLDDVQNDGYGSVISVTGNLVGVSTDALFNDHSSSSAVVNTHPGSGAIQLGGSLVMPGTAFMRFDGVNDVEDEETYFETAESASATTNEVLRAYAEWPALETESLYFYDRFVLNTSRGVADFFLVNYDVMGDKVRHLAGNLSGRVPDTGIVVPTKLEGFARGAVIARDEAGERLVYGQPSSDALPDYREMGNYTQNYLAYSEIKDSLKAQVRAKTESFGTVGLTFAGLVDKAQVLDAQGRLLPSLEGQFHWFPGGGELVLDGDVEGIVYCAAATAGAGAAGAAGAGGGGPVGAAGGGTLPKLTVRGNGSLRGALICEGDVDFAGSATVRYDEALVAKLILTYPEIAAFFAPGEMGETSYVRVLSVAQGASKTSKARYRVTEWKEWQE
jgi:hypothetical protein